MHRSVLRRTKDLLLFTMLLQEAIFWKYVRYVRSFQVRFSSIYIPRDYVNSICFIELPSIVKDGSLLKALFKI